MGVARRSPWSDFVSREREAMRGDVKAVGRAGKGLLKELHAPSTGR